MQTRITAIIALCLLVTACGGTATPPVITIEEETPGSPLPPSTTSTVSVATTPLTSSATSTSATTMPPTTWMTTTTMSVRPDAPIVIEANGPVTYGIRNGEILFTVTHDPAVFADVEMTREPNGVLASLRPGWHSYVWHVHEFVAGTENSPGDYLQVEIHRIWPADEATDVLWLTDYSGATRDTLTGFPRTGSPLQGSTFTLFDAVVLEGQLDRFGLHNDCRIAGDDIGAALLSFESGAPVPLVAWVVDADKRAFVELPDLAAIDLGDCVSPEPRN